MTDDSPWQRLQQHHAQGHRFEDALASLEGLGLTGEDLGTLFSDPTAEMTRWMFVGAGETSVRLSAVAPPADAPLPPRRSPKRGFFGFLQGESAVEGLGLFVDQDVFELDGFQFTVLQEPLRPVHFGALVELRVLALNCSAEARSLSVAVDAEPGLVQSTRRFELWLEPGVISLAVLPVRVCPRSTAVVPVFASFSSASSGAGTRRWKFRARPYAKSPDLVQLLGRSALAAARGASPLAIGAGAALSDEGSPDPLRLRPVLNQPIVVSWRAASMWRLHDLSG